MSDHQEYLEGLEHGAGIAESYCQQKQLELIDVALNKISKHFMKGNVNARGDGYNTAIQDCLNLLNAIRERIKGE